MWISSKKCGVLPRNVTERAEEIKEIAKKDPSDSSLLRRPCHGDSFRNRGFGSSVVAESALVIISVFHPREVIGCRHYEGHLKHEALIDLAAPCRQNDWGLFTLAPEAVLQSGNAASSNRPISVRLKKCVARFDHLPG